MKNIWVVLVGGVVCIGLGAYIYSQRAASENDVAVGGDTAATESSEVLTLDQLESRQAELDRRNGVKDFPSTDAMAEPTPLGTYNDLVIEERYWCGDVCPDNGLLYLSYQDVSKEQCAELGGYPVTVFGWGEQYVGCSPVVGAFIE